MNVYRFDSANEMLFCLANDVQLLIDEGQDTKSVSTGVNSTKVMELGRSHITLTDPTSCLVTLRERKNNLIGVLGEVLWVLSGESELPEWLVSIVPNLQTFCDRGLTWRGAYGPRLMEGQLEHAFTQLKLDLHTRKAVAMIANPYLDSVEGYVGEIGTIFTKDNICNLGLVFDVKDGKLDCTVMNRSNDIVWGLTNVNVAEFSIIQIIMAGMLNVELGDLHVFTTNLHSYVGLQSIKDQISQIASHSAVDANKQDLVSEINFDNVGRYTSWMDVKRHARELLDEIEMGCLDYEPKCILSSIARIVRMKVNP